MSNGIDFNTILEFDKDTNTDTNIGLLLRPIPTENIASSFIKFVYKQSPDKSMNLPYNFGAKNPTENTQTSRLLFSRDTNGMTANPLMYGTQNLMISLDIDGYISITQTSSGDTTWTTDTDRDLFGRINKRTDDSKFRLILGGKVYSTIFYGDMLNYSVNPVFLLEFQRLANPNGPWKGFFAGNNTVLPQNYANFVRTLQFQQFLDIVNPESFDINKSDTLLVWIDTFSKLDFIFRTNKYTVQNYKEIDGPTYKKQSDEWRNVFGAFDQSSFDFWEQMWRFAYAPLKPDKSGYDIPQDSTVLNYSPPIHNFPVAADFYLRKPNEGSKGIYDIRNSYYFVEIDFKYKQEIKKLFKPTVEKLVPSIVLGAVKDGKVQYFEDSRKIIDDPQDALGNLTFSMYKIPGQSIPFQKIPTSDIALSYRFIPKKSPDKANKYTVVDFLPRSVKGYDSENMRVINADGHFGIYHENIPISIKNLSVGQRSTSNPFKKFTKDIRECKLNFITSPGIDVGLLNKYIERLNSLYKDKFGLLFVRESLLPNANLADYRLAISNPYKHVAGYKVSPVADFDPALEDLIPNLKRRNRIFCVVYKPLGEAILGGQQGFLGWQRYSVVQPNTLLDVGAGLSQQQVLLSTQLTDNVTNQPWGGGNPAEGFAAGFGMLGLNVLVFILNDDDNGFFTMAHEISHCFRGMHILPATNIPGLPNYLMLPIAGQVQFAKAGSYIDPMNYQRILAEITNDGGGANPNNILESPRNFPTTNGDPPYYPSI